MPLQEINATTRETKIVIQVPQLVANGSIINNPSGTNTIGTSSATVVEAPNNNSTQPPAQNGYLIYDFRFDSPVDADGSTPDAIVQFIVGDKSVDTLVLQAGYTHNMFPAADALDGGDMAHVRFSDNPRLILDQIQKYGAQNFENIPFRLLSIPVPTDQSIQVKVSSVAGWGQSGTVKNPLTITLYTAIVDQQLCDRMQQYLNGLPWSFSAHPFGSVSGVLSIPPLSPATIDQLPNGQGQPGPTKLYRKMTFAQNNAVIGTSGQFGFTNTQSIGGAQGNIATTLSGNVQDLGDYYTSQGNGSKAFVWREFGLRFADSLITSGAYPRLWVAMYVNSRVWPGPLDHGVLVSALNNPFQYGARYPQAGGGLFVPIRSAERLLNMLSFQNNVVPVVSAANLTQLAVNTVTAFKGGIQIDGVQSGIKGSV